MLKAVEILVSDKEPTEDEVLDSALETYFIPAFIRLDRIETVWEDPDGNCNVTMFSGEGHTIKGSMADLFTEIDTPLWSRN